MITLLKYGAKNNFINLLKYFALQREKIKKINLLVLLQNILYINI